MENDVLYFPCCKALSKNTRCPVCRSKQGRSPAPGDLCFLSETEKIWSGMLEDALKQNAVPVFTQSNIGAGMAIKAGSLFERIKFYVPYSHIEHAQDIVYSLFAEIPESEMETNIE